MKMLERNTKQAICSSDNGYTSMNGGLKKVGDSLVIRDKV